MPYPRRSTISASSAIDFWMLRRTSLHDFVHLRDGLAQPGEFHFRGQRLQFAADILVADFAAAFAQQQQVAQQVVEHLEIEFQLLALAAADGLGNRQPGAERRRSGGHFQQRQHGGAALVVSVQIERNRHAGAARRQRDAALRPVQAARLDERSISSRASGAK